MKISKLGHEFHITWPIRTVNRTVFNEIKSRVVSEPDYKSLTGRKLAQFGQFVRNLASVHDTDISLEAAVSIRNVVLKGKIIKNYLRMNKLIKRISAEYEVYSVLQLSTKYDFPPLNLLRGILLYKCGCNDNNDNSPLTKSKIYDIFANRRPTDALHGRDLEQFNLAVKNDAESSFNQDEVAKIAFDNEMLVVNFFTSVGIRIKTQEELVGEQTAEHGRAVATPDILFIDSVYINGVKTHWIDYKDYICTDVPFIYNGNSEQANRYFKIWGTGALCYRYGSVDGVNINAQLLSAEYLPIKFIA